MKVEYNTVAYVNRIVLEINFTKEVYRINMIIHTIVKQAGKRKGFLVDKIYTIEKPPKTLEELITDIVTCNIEEYNHSKDSTIIHYLTEKEIEEASEVGKVSFGESKNKNKQDLEEAIENALYSFKDGLYFVLINGEKKEILEESLVLQDGDEVIFIRLVMLAGRMW